MPFIKTLKWMLTKQKHIVLEMAERWWKPYKKINLSTLFSDVSKRQNVFFVQIGANDGITNDKIRKYIETYNWHGILVEPVPYVFERLKENYKHLPWLILENSAIAEVSGKTFFYSLKQFDAEGKNLFEDFSEYKIDQLGSFNKDVILKHSYMHADFENLIQEIEVRALTVNDLLAKHLVKKIDILLIDTEGYDHKIIQSIDFSNVVPSVLIFEHHHLSKNDYKNVITLLKSKYRLFVDGWDTICVLKS